MAEARRKDAWDHTSALLAMLANCNRDPKKRPRPYRPADFHPLTERAKPVGLPLDDKNNLALLRDAFGATSAPGSGPDTRSVS